MGDILETPLELTQTTCYAIIEIPKGTNKKMEMSMKLTNHTIVQDIKDGKLRFVPRVYHDLHYEKNFFGKNTPISLYKKLLDIDFGKNPLEYLELDEDQLTNELAELANESKTQEKNTLIIEFHNLSRKYEKVRKKGNNIGELRNTGNEGQIKKLQDELKALLNNQPIIKAFTNKDPSLTPQVLQDLYGENFDKGYNLFHYGALPQTYEDPTVSYTDTDLSSKFGITEVEDTNKLIDIDGTRMTFAGLTGDGDPLDVCILDFKEYTGRKAQRSRINSSSKITILGVFAMIDDGEIDWKVLGITNPPRGFSITKYKSSSAFTDTIKNIRRWFKYYKCSLDDNGNITDGKVQISDLLSPEVAYKVIEHYHTNYTSKITSGTISKEVKENALRQAYVDIPGKIKTYEKQIQLLETQKNSLPIDQQKQEGLVRQIKKFKETIESKKKEIKYNLFLSSFPINYGRGGGRKSTRKRKQSRRKTKKQKKQKNRRKSRKSRKSRK